MNALFPFFPPPTGNALLGVLRGTARCNLIPYLLKDPSGAYGIGLMAAGWPILLEGLKRSATRRILLQEVVGAGGPTGPSGISPRVALGISAPLSWEYCMPSRGQIGLRPKWPSRYKAPVGYLAPSSAWYFGSAQLGVLCALPRANRITPQVAVFGCARSIIIFVWVNCSSSDRCRTTPAHRAFHLPPSYPRLMLGNSPWSTTQISCT